MHWTATGKNSEILHLPVHLIWIETYTYLFMLMATSILHMDMYAEQSGCWLLKTQDVAWQMLAMLRGLGSPTCTSALRIKHARSGKIKLLSCQISHLNNMSQTLLRSCAVTCGPRYVSTVQRLQIYLSSPFVSLFAQTSSCDQSGGEVKSALNVIIHSKK